MFKKWGFLTLLIIIFPVFAESENAQTVHAQIMQSVQEDEQHYADSYSYYDASTVNKLKKFYQEVKEAKDPLDFLIMKIKKKSYHYYLITEDRLAQDILNKVYIKNPNLKFFVDYYLNPKNNLSKKLFDKLSSQQLTTPTLCHLAAVNTTKPGDIPIHITDALEKALDKEEELVKNGYVVFYHGQCNKWGFVQEFTRMLINALHKNQEVQKALSDEFMFIQNSSDLKTIVNNELSEDVLSKEVKNRLKALAKGYTDSGIYSLYTNMFLFGNSNNPGSCTWQYLNNNSNIHNADHVDLSQEVFDKLKIEKYYYEVFVRSFNSLLSQYKNCFKAGRLLQIALPKDKVNECVYFGHQGKSYTKDGKPVTKITDLLNHLKSGDNKVMKNGNYGELEYVIPLTKDIMLNPDSGVKVFAYNAGIKNQATYDSIMKQMKYLAEDIVYAMQLTKYGSFFKKHPYFLTCAVARAKYRTGKILYDASLKTIEKTSYVTFGVLNSVCYPADKAAKYLNDFSYRTMGKFSGYDHNGQLKKITKLEMVKEIPYKTVAIAASLISAGIHISLIPSYITRLAAKMAYARVTGEYLV